MAALEQGAEIKERPKVNPGYAHLKEEFLLKDYKPTLIAEYVSSEVKEKLEESKGDNAIGESGEPPAKKMKLKGRNKKRPRGKRIEPGSKICPSVIRGNECSYGDRCKFSHDTAKFMSEKVADIREDCYMFDTFGKCTYGLACRFAGKHITDDFKNVVDTEGKKKPEDMVSNTLDKNLQFKLWKKQYDFSKSESSLDKVFEEHRARINQAQNGNQGDKAQTEVVPSKGTDGQTGSQSVESHSESVNSPSSENQSGREETAAKSNSVDLKEVVSASQEELKSTEENTDPDKTVCDSNTESIQSEPRADANPDVKLEPVVSDVNTTSDTMDTTEVKAVTLETDGPIRLRPQEKKIINFSDKLYLAPLTTVGNLPFRRICKRLGADVTCGEMAVSMNLLQGKASEWALLKRHESEDLFGVQICGGYPVPMTKCAQLINDNLTVDFVDINCGCPIDLIFNKGEGSALMGRHSKFEQIVRGMKGVLDVPLTVKIRTGIYGSHNIAHNLVPKLRDWGVALTTIHGRSREQRYTKSANWDYINECAKLADPMPLFGNGDVLSYHEANQRREETGVSGIMLARGALIKPWLFTEIKEQRDWDISSSERFDLLRDYANYGLEHWGSDQQGVENTRRFLLEWLSFLHRYIPVGLLERPPQKINERPPYYRGRDDLETLMASTNCGDWIKISEMLLGPVPDDFCFLPKHKANAYK